MDAHHSPFPQALAAPVRASGRGAIRAAVLALAAAAMLLLGVASSGWVVHGMRQQALQRASAQQIEEVDTVARMMAARLEQQQRLLLVLAQGMATHAADPSWLLREALHGEASPARLFDSLQLADARGQLQISLRGGRSQPLVDLEPAVRDTMLRSLVDGKPAMATLARKGAGAGAVELLYAVPLRTGNGTVGGVLSAGMRMSAQALLPPSIDAAHLGSRLLLIQRDGEILAHTDPERWMARAEAEPGLGGDWLGQRQGQNLQVRPDSEQRDGYLVTWAGMPLPQWLVVKTVPLDTIAPGLPARHAWWLAALVLGATLALVLALALVTHPLAVLHQSARRWLTGVRPEALEPQRSEDGGWRRPWVPAWGEAATLWQALHRLSLQGREQAQEVERLQWQIRTLMDYAPVGLVVTRASRLDLVGLQAARMLGYRPGELQGHPIRLLCASDEAHERLLERVRKDLDMYGQFDSEQCFVRKDGRQIWVRMHGQSVQRLQRGVEPQAERAAEPSLVWIVEDVSLQRVMREQPVWKALHDPLTRLPNREAFALHLHDWLKECTARQQPAAVLAGGGDLAEAAPGSDAMSHHGVILFLDLDHFAHVNQQGGHAAGDEVLCHMARLIESVVRPLGWVARLGGDEFAVLLAGIPPEQGMLFAQSLCMAVQDWEGSHGGQRYLMGASVGMVVLDARQHTVSSALRGADMACYAAKRKGRNRVEVLVEA